MNEGKDGTANGWRSNQTDDLSVRLSTVQDKLRSPIAATKMGWPNLADLVEVYDRGSGHRTRFSFLKRKGSRSLDERRISKISRLIQDSDFIYSYFS